MADQLTPDTMNRTAKLFLDRGDVEDYESAIERLQGFRLYVAVGAEVASSRAHQIALLTLVNAGGRSFLGGVHVSGLTDAPLLAPLADATSIAQAVVELGGRLIDSPGTGPTVCIGTVAQRRGAAWQLTWSDWSGGAVPSGSPVRLCGSDSSALGPLVAAAMALALAFRHCDGDGGARFESAGLSLWSPGADWQNDSPAPSHSFLPSRLWLLGLGNLGQAYLWTLAALPYADPGAVELFLQDFDQVATANVSTSLLSWPREVGSKKTRMTSSWAERRGFATSLVERRFGPETLRSTDEPAVALCGFDNALARSGLEDARFDLVVEAGLGAGPDGFMDLAVHCFPGRSKASELWRARASEPRVANAAPYERLARAGKIDACGAAMLASRTVGVPFVGLVAATLVVAELLRRLNGRALDAVALSLRTPNDVERLCGQASPYAWGFVEAASG